jgi:hypothetical protein
MRHAAGHPRRPLQPRHRLAAFALVSPPDGHAVALCLKFYLRIAILGSVPVPFSLPPAQERNFSQ